MTRAPPSGPISAAATYSALKPRAASWARRVMTSSVVLVASSRASSSRCLPSSSRRAFASAMAACAAKPSRVSCSERSNGRTSQRPPGALLLVAVRGRNAPDHEQHEPDDDALAEDRKGLELGADREKHDLRADGAQPEGDGGDGDPDAPEPELDEDRRDEDERE